MSGAVSGAIIAFKASTAPSGVPAALSTRRSSSSPSTASRNPRASSAFCIGHSAKAAIARPSAPRDKSDLQRVRRQSQKARSPPRNIVPLMGRKPKRCAVNALRVSFRDRGEHWAPQSLDGMQLKQDARRAFAFTNDSFSEGRTLRKTAQRIEFPVIPFAPCLAGRHIARPLRDICEAIGEVNHGRTGTPLHRAPDFSRDLFAPCCRTLRHGFRADVDGEIDIDCRDKPDRWIRIIYPGQLGPAGMRPGLRPAPDDRVASATRWAQGDPEERNTRRACAQL